MTKGPSKALIGGFVLGGLALAVAAVAVLGSGKLFQKRVTYVMFFGGSITGLSVGSPVEFRGVKIGEVTRIAATFNPRTLDITIPVYVDIDRNSLIVPQEEQRWMGEDPGQLYKPLIDKGLKAQLEIQSLITRQLYVSVDFHPELPTRLLGTDPRYPEIPTIPSVQEQIVQTLQTLPQKVMSATDAIQRWVESPALQESTRELAQVLRDLDAVVRALGAEVKPLATSMTATSDAARRTFAQAERTLALKEGPAAELAASIAETVKKAGASLDQARVTLSSYDRVAAQNSNLGYDLSRTLAELDEAARAVRSLADYLERNPEAVLKGRR
jgi:phospholipid/cholesterol/gamma-HCH transport system substrate-binding protein